MVIKKDGATMTCNNCDTELICRMKEYGGNFASTLQWQNYDGTAHYKTTDGKNFTCNIPDEEETAQTRITSESAKTEGDAPPKMDKAGFQANLHLEEKIEELNIRLVKIDEMVQAIFRYTVDEQLKKK